MRCGTWVEVCTTSCPVRSSCRASTALPSIGTMHWRAVRYSRSMTTAARFLTDSMSPSAAGGQEEVVPPLLVHQRRIGAACGEAVGDRRQRVEVELHRLGDVLGLGPGRGDAERQALAGEAHLAAGERRVVGGFVRGQARLRTDRAHAFHVRGGEHPARVPLGHGDSPDAGMGEGAAHERDLPQSGEGEVADELRLAGQVPGVFLAGHAGPDPRRHVRCLPRLSARGRIVPRRPRLRPPRDVAREVSRSRTTACIRDKRARQ